MTANPILEPYRRAIDRRPALVATDELEQATEIRRLRCAYWSALLSRPALAPSIARLARQTLGDKAAALPRFGQRPRDRAAFVDQLVDLDVSCDIADRILADMETRSAHGVDADFLCLLQRRRLALHTARKIFAAANLRLVLTIAARYRRTGFLPYPDLVQEGNVGLMMAVDRFDPRRGFRFSTYAAWWIRHAITRALSGRGRAVRLPTHIIELRSSVGRFRDAFEARHRRPPSNQEIADGVGVPVDKIDQLERVMMQQDFPAPGDRGPLGAVDRLDALEGAFEDPAARIDAATAADVLRQGLERLPRLERDIVRLRFGLDDGAGLTLREVGERFSLSRERIRQLQVRALGRLRDTFDAVGVGSPFPTEAAAL